MGGVAGKEAFAELNGTAASDGEVRRRIVVNGIVQGVGFRPFVYRQAVSQGLDGFIRNTSSGVMIEVQGAAAALSRFFDALSAQAPPLARIGSISVEDIPVRSEGGFIIDSSAEGSSVETLIPPDIALCDRCRAELSDPEDRRYGYPFINCTDCGPRYTIVERIPYDRPFTSMKGFVMCADCMREYRDPLDRRFHAQPDACPVCGPVVSLLDGSGEPLSGRDAIRDAAELLRQGRIVAVKGIGGFHLAVDARNGDAVRRLRQRKQREEKPFAVMVSGMETVKRLCLAGEGEEAALRSPEAPVVLLLKSEGYDLHDAVAPENARLGVMLPYSPLHALLMAYGMDVLVMTSANVSDEPVLHDDGEAFLRLAGIADAFLVHNRPIVQRCDDSVGLYVAGALRLVRRSRGFVPAPVVLDGDGPTLLATGGELKNTLCLLHGRNAILSQHLGDMKNYETWRFFGQTALHLQGLFRAVPELVVHDLHPDYLTTRWACEQRIPALGVQHHHAHLASCLAENREQGPAIGLLLDGTGYGPDGTIWGGEVLVGDAASAHRFASLERMPLPGGDAAVFQPWRAATGYLHRSFGNVPDLPFLDGLPSEQVAEMLDRRINSPETSSCGRLFDVIAAISGYAGSVTYEGQAAAALMHAAGGSVGVERFGYGIEDFGGRLQMLVSPIIRDSVDAVRRGMERAEISRRFHRTLCDMLCDIAARASAASGVRTVALSGGVFQNTLLFETLVTELQASGYRVLCHAAVPCNDGGLSLGQAVIGREYLRGKYGGVGESI
ncbi:MAG: carbamoyltransferase HypF [Chlorobi bacterium]|nr:carbamoyltransferase HypF [Chlorobiota bacterium]